MVFKGGGGGFGGKGSSGTFTTGGIIPDDEEIKRRRAAVAVAPQPQGVPLGVLGQLGTAGNVQGGQTIDPQAAAQAGGDGGGFLGGLGDAFGQIGQGIGDVVGGVQDFASDNPKLFTGLVTTGIGLASGLTTPRALSAGSTAIQGVASQQAAAAQAQAAGQQQDFENQLKTGEFGLKGDKFGLDQDKAAFDQKMRQKEFDQRDRLANLNARLSAQKDAKSQAGVLRKEFINETKSFSETKASQDKIESSIAQGTAAGDLGAIFSFMKVLDPGSSVREGEFANAQNSAGVSGRMRSAYNNALDGTRLNEEQRKDFLSTSRSLFAAEQQRFDTSVDRYSTLAEQTGVDPSQVVFAKNTPQGGGILKAPQGAPQQSQQGAPAQGSKHITF